MTDAPSDRPTARDTGPANPFVSFMAAGPGRLVRFGLGAGAVLAGVFVGPPVGYLLAAAGLTAVAAGAANLCPVAPLWGGHFSGARYCAAPAAVRTDERDQR